MCWQRDIPAEAVPACSSSFSFTANAHLRTSAHQLQADEDRLATLRTGESE
jgi:hypothetical protein